MGAGPRLRGPHAGPLVAAALWAPGCRATADRSSLPDCADANLDVGQVRVCRLGSSDVPSGSGAKLSDWRLQNALLDVIVRDVHVPLTRLEGAGGTVLAASPTGYGDPVLELIPDLPGGWFDSVDIDPYLDGDEAILELTGTQADGTDAVLRYRLAADSPTLRLDGAEGFVLVPQSGDVRVGATLEHGSVVVAAEGDIDDAGGALHWLSAGRVTVAPRVDAYRERWPDALEVEGQAPGAEWVEARVDGDRIARLSVDDEGWFAGPLPSDADVLVARASGYADGPEVAPSAAPTLELGGAGSLRIRVADDRGADIWATVERDGLRWPIPPGGRALPVGAGVADTLVWAGPGYELQQIEALEVGEDTELSLSLYRVGGQDPHVLAQIGLLGWPDATTRGLGNDLLAGAASRGVGFAVVVAEDEVAQSFWVDHDTDAAIRYRTGSAAATDAVGEPLAWPWTPDSEQPGHGAVPWPGLDAWQLLDVMDRVGTRQVVVDLPWIDAAGVSPDGRLDVMALRLTDVADLDDWLALVDRGETMAAVGPWTWVEGVDPAAFSEVDVERALWEGRTVATTGPRIRLRVQGQGPGSTVTPSLNPAPETSAEPLAGAGALAVHLDVETPSWAPVDVAALYGPGGQELARFDARAGDRVVVDEDLLLTDVDWIVAAAWGSEDAAPTGAVPWAITTPVRVRR